ncbi:HAD family hydrolase [Actinoallomurus bryophytorum]|uniref:HAD superfamily hydrolase (TIGR01509 family)/HAD superfamily hydrolase (TIGR01549 family) n=1 Tax=Actinoallomurus bryophytorum TaxID=1490222 RepID=A0A543CFT8_9ACTN|nr:HAD family hydrolase [Actinoallomurus bryophytorum]TQL95959.1 HAD superfamily hydrolase (TIGR01509 family)/HAD superfamily hydrolase (TIGR01549 family) [Actinoallomurus bryophytorum]
MTHPDTALADVMNRSRYLLFDFDGPICGIFAGLPAHRSRPICASCGRRGVDIPPEATVSGDPFDVSRYAASTTPDLTQAVADELRTMELRAVEVADDTPQARQVIEAAHQAGRAIAAVSNNSREAVTRYLTTAGLAPMFTKIIGRTEPDPDLLKPNPYLITRAVKELGADPTECVLIGDSLSDIDGAGNAGVFNVGYTNKPGKLERFTTAGADAVITSMGELLPHLAE